jgi:probable phosphoglycerate mutase
MTTFYICRHGETENNKKLRLSGWVDTPLTEAGLQDIQSAITKLHGIQFDSVYSSDLGRAFITAYIITRGIGYTDEVYRYKGLREVNYGDFANLRWADVDPQGLNFLNDTDFVSPNGESLAQMQQRVIACLGSISKEHPEQTILLVSHDGPMNAIYTSFANIDLGDRMKTNVYPHDFVAKFSVSNGKVLSFNEVLNQ